ncbi:MAG: hypothetical protein RBU21_11125 [FCB group bacterium]|jgi:hypothetical protein|nr:hypothetical protein [FCB group bacterium]
MRRLLLALLLTVSAGAFAATFQSRLVEGNELLRQNKIADALSIFEGLEVEEPNAPDLLFSLGCAEYLMANKDKKGAADRLEAARDYFEKAQTLSSGRLSTDAGYNRANALARLAERQQEPKQKQEGYEEASKAYEQFLQQHPDHARAKHNLDYVRAKLKKEEQNPPPPEQSQQNQDQDKQDKGDQQQQQQQQGGQGDQNNQQQDDKQDQQGEEKDPQQQEDQQQQQPSQQDPQDQQQKQPKAQAGDEKKDHETVKSLLESLEDVDQEEQKRLRDAPHEPTIQEEWW